MIFLILIVISCLILSALFSATETALTTVSPARVLQLKLSKVKNATILDELIQDKESLISTILLANNIVNILASTLTTAILIKIYGDQGVLYATIIITIMIILFSEILPKTYAINNAEKFSLFIAPIMKLIVFFFLPVTKFIKLCILKFFSALNIKKYIHDSNSIKDDIKNTITLHHSSGLVKKNDKDMLNGILDLADIYVKTVMIHRKNIFSLDINLDFETICTLALNSKFSRIPMWEKNPENIVGILHIKDLFKYQHQSSPKKPINIRNIISKPWFIPENTNLKDQLAYFRDKKNHIAIIVDEYGALEGIITITDILEEIIGKFEDEHHHNNDIIKKSKNLYKVAGHVTIRELNRIADWDLPDEHASTIAGLFIYNLENIPKKNETLNIKNYILKVIKTQNNQILFLEIKFSPPKLKPKETNSYL